MVYVDSSVFVAATLGNESHSVSSRELLRKVQDKTLTIATATLTVDELFWAVARKSDRASAVHASKALLQGHVQFISVTREIVSNAITLLEQTTLKPRDAIHVACMQKAGEQDMITLDHDFNTVKSVKSSTPEQFLKTNH